MLYLLHIELSQIKNKFGKQIIVPLVDYNTIYTVVIAPNIV